MIAVSLFKDAYLEEFFQRHQSFDICEITGYETYCIEPRLLRPVFEPVVKLYETYEPEQAMALFQAGSASDDGSRIWNLIYDHFGVFNPQNEEEDNEAILKIIYQGTPYYEHLDKPAYRFDHIPAYNENLEGDIEFENEYWDKFKEEIKYRNRFFPEQTIDLERFAELLKWRKKTIYMGSEFFRARSGNRQFSTSEMGAPPCHFATMGRANPKGISYLYLGKTKEICRKEIKIDATQSCTYGKFERERLINPH